MEVKQRLNVVLSISSQLRNIINDFVFSYMRQRAKSNIGTGLEVEVRHRGQRNSCRTNDMLVPGEATALRVLMVYFHLPIPFSFCIKYTELRLRQSLKWRQKIAYVLLLSKEQIKKFVLPFQGKFKPGLFWLRMNVFQNRPARKVMCTVLTAAVAVPEVIFNHRFFVFWVLFTDMICYLMIIRS